MAVSAEHWRILFVDVDYRAIVSERLQVIVFAGHSEMEGNS